MTTIAQFQKISIPTPGMVTGNSKGERCSKIQHYFFERKYVARLEFREGWGWGCQIKKTFYGERVWIFSGTTYPKLG